VVHRTNPDVRHQQLFQFQGLKARDVKAWGEARSAQPQVHGHRISPALKGRHVIAQGEALGSQCREQSQAL